MKKIATVWLGLATSAAALAQPTPISPGRQALVGHPAKTVPPVTAQDLGNALQYLVTQGLPGASAAVATRQGVVWTGTAGAADLTTGRPLHEANLLGVGSITKTFVAVLVLQLSEEGKLPLQRTVQDVLGRAAVRGIPNADRATLAQLLDHTGGVPSWEDDSLWIRQGRGQDMDVRHRWGKTETLAYVRDKQPLNDPGREFHYANTNYTLLGLVVEKVTGHDITRELQTRIFQPLGLRDTFLEGFEAEPADRLARRYQFATPEFRRTAGVATGFPEVQPGLLDVSAANLSVEWTAGGLVTTARDLATFALALRDGRLLKPASQAFLQAWQPVGPGWQVGHGVFRDQRFGARTFIGHDGGVLGCTACFFWVEGTDAVIVLLTNAGVMHAGKVPVNILRAAKGSAFTEWAIAFAAQCAAP